VVRDKGECRGMCMEGRRVRLEGKGEGGLAVSEGEGVRDEYVAKG